MSMHLILGRAGYGKTALCIEQIRRRMADPASRGRVIFIVPEQFSLTAEVLLARGSRVGGCIGSEVLSFTRLAHACEEELGHVSAKPLSSVAKAITVSDVLCGMESDGKLTHFERQAHSPGFAPRVVSFISESKRYRVAPEDFRRFADSCEDRRTGQKFRELADIYEDFNLRLSSLGKDGDDDLTFLADAVPGCASLRGAHIWIDGFLDFLPQHMEVIRALAAVAGDVTLTVPVDPLNPDDPLFRKGCSTWLGITEMCREMHIQYDAVTLTNNMRHGPDSALAWIESTFGELKPRRFAGSAEGVRFASCTDPFMECGMVAESIAREVRSGSVSYSDIAVAAGSLEEYAGLIQPVFEEYGIPFFFDSGDSISACPLPVCIVSALHAVIDRGEISDRIFSMLRTGLTPIGDDETDILENYILLRGVRFLGQWLRLDPAEDDRIPQSAGTVREMLEFLSGMLRSSMTAGDFVTAVASFMQKYMLPRCEAASQLPSDGTPDRIRRASEFSQIWNKVLEVLENLRKCAGDGRYTPKQLTLLLSSGLEETAVASIPTTQDLVVISSLGRIRAGGMRSVYIIGAHETAFPPLPGAAGIIPDADRQMLRQFGIEMAPTADTVASDLNYEAYAALTLSSERLSVSYSCSDPTGKRLEPASLVKRLADGLGLPIEPYRFSVSGGTSFARFIGALGSNRSALQHILSNYSRAPYGRPDPVPETGLFTALWNRFLRQEYPARVCGSLIRENLRRTVPFEVSNGVQTLNLLRGGTVSVTGLEDYASCPMKCYFGRILAARDRSVFEPNAADIGSLVHSVLFSAGTALSRREEWDSVTSLSAAREWTEQYLDERFSNDSGRDLLRTFAGVQARDYISAVVSAAVFASASEMRETGFRPHSYEVSFGQPGGLPPLCIGSGADELLLSGKIDRVDTMRSGSSLFLRVLDYKTSNHRMSLGDLYYGASLQPPLYLLGFTRFLTDQGVGAAPYAMGYMSLSGSPTGADGSLIDANKPSVITEGGPLTSASGLGRIPAHMAKILDYSAAKALELGRGIRRGLFPAEPLCQDSCRNCGYSMFCGARLYRTRFIEDQEVPAAEMIRAVNGEEDENADNE